MKTASKRGTIQKRPKHKQTKGYLKHYYPFLPLMASIGFLAVALLSPFSSAKSDVLAYNSNITANTLLASTNQTRQSNDSSSLIISPKLNAAAQAKANDMTTKNYWSHQTPDGNEPWTLITNTNYSYQKAGENLAYGFDDSADVVRGWINSAEHRHNMLDNDFTEVGFGVASSPDFNGSGAANVVVAMYAKPNTSKPAGAADISPNTPLVLGNSKKITLVESLTQASWLVYVIGALIGASATYLLLTHSLTLKKSYKKSERFFIKHPLLDSVIIAGAGIGVILLKSVGTIL